MLVPFKKAVGVIAAAGAIALGGSAVAHAGVQLEVPDVEGQTVTEATETLYDAGFDNVASNGQESEELVVRTNYPAGTYVDEDTTIVLIVVE